MERMELLQERVMETTTETINKKFQLSAPIEKVAELIHSLHVTFSSRINPICLASIKRGFFNSAPGTNQENMRTNL